MEIDPRSNVHLDWFDFTVSVDRLPAVLDRLNATFGALGDEQPGRYNVRYNRCRRFGGDGGVFWSADDLAGFTAPEAFVSLKGSVLALATADQQFELCEWLESTWDPMGGPRDYKPTRFDVAFDDWNWLITPAEIWERYCLPGNFGPFRRKLQFSGGRDDGTGGPGFTIHLGLRGKLGGGVMLAIYDKRAESAGLVDAVRYEARFYDPKASQAWAEVMVACSCVEEWTVRMGKLVGGCADFYEAAGSDERNIGRRMVAPWWGTIRGWLWRSSREGGPRAPRRSRHGGARVGAALRGRDQRVL